jgi:hypothetical protein
MGDVLTRLRAACAEVAERAGHVSVVPEAVSAYAASLPLGRAQREPDSETHPGTGVPEELAAFWLTLDAVNFGSGWFPTLRKRPGRGGYFTVAIGIRERFRDRGPWSAAELASIGSEEVAATLGQDPTHELMSRFATSLQNLGRHVATEFHGSFLKLARSAPGAVELAERLGAWECFADRSEYQGFEVPFLKRAQIAAADLARTGVVSFGNLDRLTMFADNLVPHVLRLDGVLVYKLTLLGRIERGELLEHGSPEEVEIRACGLHAVELIAAECQGTCPAEIDRVLWNRGQLLPYKAVPRHRSRCTAY